MSSTQRDSDLSRAARFAIPFVLLSFPFWLNKVNSIVPEPYLDEVFHVPQAQAYWAHRWLHWDPKITTPPGLYVWSYVICAVALVLRGSPKQLDAAALRTTNTVAGSLLLPWRLQALLDKLRGERNQRPVGAWLSHQVLNICLFPPLFFFSGLYYTDVLAVLAVVETYNWDLKRSREAGSATWKTLVFVVVGLVALVCRQTNIFWVAVFLGGLQVVRTLQKLSKPITAVNFADVAATSLQNNELYDPLVAEASIADYGKTAISLAAVSIRNIPKVLGSLLPYLVILGAFGTFVIWNGGVVLGHKEFHTAGIHLAQMLYIWPYIVFFSWPILVVPMLNLAIPDTYLPKVLHYGFSRKQKGLPGLVTVAVVLSAMLAVVHFNTVVHPFTLADNRHYVFYAFRLLLSHHPAVRYLAVLAYFVCAWIALSAFGFSTARASTASRMMQVGPSTAETPASDPPTERSTKKTRQQTKSFRKSATAKKTDSGPESQLQPIPTEVLARVQAHILQRKQQQEGAGRVSFVLVWLIATSLSLITAPLVEPRYFIIPWVMWRLHLPPQPVPRVYRDAQPGQDDRMISQAKFETNMPVLLETIWYLIINAVTGYVFLFKGFEWPQEPGKVQRFMW